LAARALARRFAATPIVDRESADSIRVAECRPHTRARRRFAVGDAMDDDSTLPAAPSARALGDEVSLEQCERLFVCAHFAECRAMCERVYAAYVDDPSAPRPLVRGTSSDARESGARARATAREDSGIDAAVAAAARRLRRPERYLDEIYGECSCSEDEDEGSERNAERRALARDAESVRWPVEDLRERDAAWVTSCLWVQCKFKSKDGLGRTMAEDFAELRRRVRVGTPPRLGPTARMLWCKLKWEEGAGKTAGSREEAEIEREILALFDDAAAANVLNDENMSEELNVAWRDALRNLGWLYASQILAAQREDEDAAHAWLDKREDLLDEQIIVLTRSWIQKANINKNYRFSVSYDEHTGRVMVKNQRVDDDGEDENASDDDAPAEENETEITKSSPTAAPEPVEDDGTNAEKVSTVDALASRVTHVVREIARDPTGDYSLRAYATVAVSAYVAFSLVQRVNDWRNRAKKLIR